MYHKRRANGGLGMGTQADSSGSVLVKPNCTRCCPICCLESVAEIEARTEASVRVGMVKTSAVVTYSLLFAHIFYYVWKEKVIPIPDWFYFCAAAPMIGAGGQKLIKMIADGRPKKETKE